MCCHGANNPKKSASFRCDLTKEASGGLNPASSQGYLEVSSVPWIKSIEQHQPSNPDMKFHEILIGL